MSYTQEQLKGMSDLEIEMALAAMLGVEYHLSPSDSRNKTDQWIFATDGDTTNLPNYCTDWSVTGPLMVEYGIGINKLKCENNWIATEGDVYARNPNPLRAVCEVILMMEKA